jgi:hypothetical protein
MRQQNSKKKKFVFWLFGFTMPFFLLALVLTFYGPITEVDIFFGQNQVFFEWIAKFVLGFEVVQIWVIKKIQKVEPFLINKITYWFVWGLASWAILVSSLFLLLPIILWLTYA